MIKRLQGALAFADREAVGGLTLVAAAVAALILSNTPPAPAYFALFDAPVTIRFGDLAVDKPLLLWINDGLMAVFFFLVGLEIKREVMAGELSTREQAMLPVIAAVGGMAVPALIYIALNAGDPKALRGWAIPAATDIAFALGVLALLGPRVPPALKIFLLALAIIDDLGAIVIIALFFTADLSVTAMVLAALGCAVLAVLNARGVARLWIYAIVGVFIWVCVLKSGIHATLAGVVAALAVPLRVTGSTPYSPLEQAEHRLHPWVNFGILPLFAFANAGVSFEGVAAARLLTPIPLGIALGLFAGKQLGILAFTWAAIKLRLGARPGGVTWLQLYGTALLGGIGFTMSLFIGLLAFPEPQYAADIRLGVLTGSLLSAIAGYCVLRYALSQE